VRVFVCGVVRFACCQPVTQALAQRQLSALNWMTAYYAFISSLAQALGAICSGFAVTWLQNYLDFSPADSYRLVCVGYTVCGVLMWALFMALSPAIEPDVSWHCALCVCE
jgi:hypothetical protein